MSPVGAPSAADGPCSHKVTERRIIVTKQEGWE